MVSLFEENDLVGKAARSDKRMMIWVNVFFMGAVVL